MIIRMEKGLAKDTTVTGDAVGVGVMKGGGGACVACFAIL